LQSAYEDPRPTSLEVCIMGDTFGSRLGMYSHARERAERSSAAPTKSTDDTRLS